MVSIKGKRKPAARQSRSLHTAVYTAPSKREYAVQVISVDRRDNSAQIVYQWTKGKVVRAWVSVDDVEGVR